MIRPGHRNLITDVAGLRGRGAWAEAHAHHMMAEMEVVIASPDLVSKDTVHSPSDYLQYPLIQNSHRPDSWLRWLSAMGLARPEHISGPRFAQTSMVIEAALSGIGIAVVPTIMVERHLAQGRLYLPFGDPVPSGLSYFVVYPLRVGVSKPVLDFRDWVLSQVRDREAG